MPDIPNVVYAILGFGFIIFIHELGHFLAAKLFGVKVKAFSIGFPPTILHRQHGETDYRVGIIPMGGYVSMLGEDPREPTDDPRALCNILPWRRGVIFLAGVTMNVVTAMVIYIVASVIGIEVTQPVVGQAVEGRSAQAAGLRAGDRILTIDGEKIASFEDIKWMETIHGLNDPEHQFEIQYERDGKLLRTTATATTGGAIEGLPDLGIEPPVLPVFTRIEPDSPADQAGLKDGDRIVAVNGRPTPFFFDCKDMLEVWPEQPVTLTVRRLDKPLEADGSPGVYRQIDIKVNPATVTAPDYGFQPPLTIEEADEGKPAQKAGLKDGDFIVRAGDKTFPSVNFISNLIRKSEGKPVTLSVHRDGHDQPISIAVAPERESERHVYLIGVVFKNWGADTDEPVVLRRPGNAGAAHKAGIPEGATITGVNGRDVKSWRRLFEQLHELKGKQVQVTYTEAGSDEEKTATVTPDEVPPEVLLAGTVLTEFMTGQLDPIYNPLRALNIGLKKIHRLVFMQYVTLKAIARKQVPAKEISGPLRIAVFFYEVSKMGLSRFMMLLGLISVAIALLNAMPIPPLDGGHVMFLVVEKIIRQPVSLKVRGIVTMAGTVLLLCLVAFAFYNDGRWMLKNYFY